ncbi:MAG TPA: hypothetical protein VE596_09815 [Gaiellaceae bacterium]|jgi:hypothetical protein|nr:hypothetical protein [Gaiellaceae bacterium]
MHPLEARRAAVTSRPSAPVDYTRSTVRPQAPQPDDTTGSAHGRFSRAIANRTRRGAETAARELGWLSLEDALQLLPLYAATSRARYERAALHGLERLLAERRLSLEEVGLAVGALSELRDGKSAASTFTLRRLARRA